MFGVQVTERWWVTTGTKTKEELQIVRKVNGCICDSWKLRNIHWANPDRRVEIQDCLLCC